MLLTVPPFEERDELRTSQTVKVEDACLDGQPLVLLSDRSMLSEFLQLDLWVSLYIDDTGIGGGALIVHYRQTTWNY